MVAILMVHSKLATLGVLKTKLFWNKIYDILVLVHKVTNKILSSDSNYIVDLVIWAKFGNSTLSLWEVVIATILLGFDQKKQFFWWLLLVQVWWFGIGTRCSLEILRQCDKIVKTKSQIVLWANSHAGRNYRKKTCRGIFLPPPSWIGL